MSAWRVLYHVAEAVVLVAGLGVLTYAVMVYGAPLK